MRTASIVVAASLAWPALGGAAPRAVEQGARTRIELPVKPTGPIAVEHRLASAPQVGVPLAIAVTARVETAVAALRIEANASLPRAVLVTPPALVTAGDGVYSWEVTIVPLAAEAGYLSVIVSGEVDGTLQAQSLTISLRSPGAGGPAPVAAAAGAETLIALPVQESP